MLDLTKLNSFWLIVGVCIEQRGVSPAFAPTSLSNFLRRVLRTARTRPLFKNREKKKQSPRDVFTAEGKAHTKSEESKARQRQRGNAAMAEICLYLSSHESRQSTWRSHTLPQRCARGGGARRSHRARGVAKGKGRVQPIGVDGPRGVSGEPLLQTSRHGPRISIAIADISSGRAK